MTRKEQEQKAIDSFCETRARMVSFKIPNVQPAATVFFTNLVLRLEPVIDWKIPTACTDGDKLWLNPAWWLGLTQDEKFTICAHEPAHIAQLHHLRQGDRDLDTWNIAGDLAINSWLVEAGFTMPKKGCVPGRPPYGHFEAGLSAEEYYDLLTQKNDEEGDDGQGKQGDGQGGEQGDGQGDEDQDGDGQGGAGAGQPEGDGEGDQQGEGGPSQSPGAGLNGPAPNDHGGCGAVTEAPHDEAERSEKEGKAKVAVAQAAQSSRTQGQAPGWLKRLVDEVLMPKEDWRDILREFVTKQARNEFSYRRPNRRMLQQGVVMPSLSGDELGDVIVTVDCSGSIGQHDLNVFAAELEGIVETFVCKVTILYHDVPVTHVQEWQPSEGPLRLTPHGGGGTSHVPVFEYIERKLQDGDAPCIICFTDLYTTFPASAPRLPVMWAVYGKDPHNYRPKVPFGRVIEIKE